MDMLKILFKKIIKFMLVKLNLMRLFYLFAPPGKLVILNYHRMSDKKEEKPLSLFDIGVTREKFEKEMRHLARNYSVIPFSQAVDLLKNENNWPRFPVVISFDDGYRDIYLNAFPVLEKFNLPAIVFISTRMVEQGVPFWWDELEDFVEHNHLEEIKLALENCFSPEYDLDLGRLMTIQDKRVFLKTLTEQIKKIKGKYRDELLNRLKSLLKSGKEKTREVLSWEEIRKLRRNQIEFGSHSHSHYLLTFEDQKTVTEELKTSKQKLEENLEEKIEFLSYPSGLYNSEIEKLAEECGYKAGCSNLYGFNHKETDFFSLKRLSLEESQSLDDFKISLGRLFGALPFLKD
jgi:peptidoglycan/xylan/chitin deacetylase (PgdA/CDA1 family)